MSESLLNLSLNVFENTLLPSFITHFRKRFSADILNEVNERIAGINKKEKKQDDDDNKKDPPGASEDGKVEIEHDEEGENCRKSGKLILDATCVPADIQYPTVPVTTI